MATRDRADSAEACIKEILENHSLDFELVVLNNGSQDRTESMLRELDDPRLRVLDGNIDLGLYGFVKLAGEARGRVFTWLSDEDSLNFQNVRTVITSFESNSDLDVILTNVVYGDYWRLIRYGKQGLRRYREALPILLSFSGLAGVFVRNHGNSTLLPVNEKLCYSLFNYYPIGFVAASYLREKLLLSNDIVAVQTRFEQTTNRFASRRNTDYSAQPHYYPSTIIDRFVSNVQYAKRDSRLSNTQRGAMCGQFAWSLQYQFSNVLTSTLKLISESYPEDVVDLYLYTLSEAGLDVPKERKRIIRDEVRKMARQQPLSFRLFFYANVYRLRLRNRFGRLIRR